MKCFKHVDTAGEGIISFEQWVKAIEKIGIVVPSIDDLKLLFELYDLDKDEKLLYVDFVDKILGKTSKFKEIDRSKVLSELTNLNPILPGNGLPIEKNFQAEEIIQNILSKLIDRGVRGIFMLAKEFRNTDENNTQVINIAEFKQSFLNIRFEISEYNIEFLFNTFDISKAGYISYLEFLRRLKGLMNEFRTKLVLNAFKFLDKNPELKLSYQQLISSFDVEGHPDYLLKKRTRAEIVHEFVEIFEIHHCYIWNKKEDDSIFKEEFVDFYSYISLSIKNDEYFMHILHSAWNIPLPLKARPYSLETENLLIKKFSPKKGVRNFTSNDNPFTFESIEKENIKDLSHQKNLDNLYNKIRNQLASRGPKGIIGLIKKFVTADDEKLFRLPEALVTKIFIEYRIDIDRQEMIWILEDIDLEKEGNIHYLKLIENIRGKLNPFRKSIIEMAFKKFDRYGRSIIDFQFFKRNFVPKYHPDVLIGKKTENEILEEFLDTLEDHHLAFSGSTINDPFISKDEFFEYFENVSSSIEKDEYFEQLTINTFRLLSNPSHLPSRVIKGQYITETKKQQPEKGKRAESKGLSEISVDNAIVINRNKHSKSIEYNPSYTIPCWPKKSEITSKIRPLSGKLRSKKKNYDLTAKLDENKNKNILELFRQTIQPRGIRGILGLWRQLQNFQINNSGFIDLTSFACAIKGLRIKFNDQMIGNLFKAFDIELKKLVPIIILMKGIIGEMNGFRRNLVSNIYKKLDIESNEKLTIDYFKSLFSASTYPDVLLGKKNKEEAFCEFVDALEMNHTFLKKDKLNYVNCDEFLNLYNLISIVTPDDKYFETIVQNSWNRALSNSIGKKRY